LHALQEVVSLSSSHGCISLYLQVLLLFLIYFSVSDRGSVLLTLYFAGGKIKKNEMDWACGAYGGEERCAQGFGGEA
jgi:hypothetical protein